MERILQNTAATLRATFSIDGEAPDPAPTSATVEVLRADGTVLVDTTAATDEGDGIFSYVLPQTDAADLGVLEARWTATIEGQPSTITTRFEVVGGFYFTIAEFRARYPRDTAEVDAGLIADARATAEDIIEGLNTEDGTHVAWVPRAETFTLRRDGRHRVSVPRYMLRKLLAVVIDGVAQANLSDITVESSSLYSVRWPRNLPVTVTVSHGADEPPRELKDAAMVLAHDRLLTGPIDDRATGRLTPEGAVITLATPGVRGAVTGLPGVDQAIASHRRPKIVPVSASLREPDRHRLGESWGFFED